MICRQFGGDILVHSEWGKGSNFTFLFALDEPKNKSDLIVSRNVTQTQDFMLK